MWKKSADTLAAISARTLIVHGDRDPLYPVELAVEIYRAIPRAVYTDPETGSVGMLLALDLDLVLLGHAERRRDFHVNDVVLNR